MAYSFPYVSARRRTYLRERSGAISSCASAIRVRTRSLFDTLIGRITRTLVRTGVLIEDPEHPWLDIYPDHGGDNALEQLAGATVRYRIGVGPIAGRKTMTLHSPVNLSGECASAKALTAARDGFSLNASVVCEAHQRAQTHSPDELDATLNAQVFDIDLGNCPKCGAHYPYGS